MARGRFDVRSTLDCARLDAAFCLSSIHKSLAFAREAMSAIRRDFRMDLGKKAVSSHRSPKVPAAQERDQPAQ